MGEAEQRSRAISHGAQGRRPGAQRPRTAPGGHRDPIDKGRCRAYNFGYNAPESVMKLKITAIGNSAGLILPKELLARLRVDKGDELYALETPDGIRLTIYDPEFAAQMDIAEEIMREDRNVLRKLAE